MATVSNRSAGSQMTPRGPVQGSVIVDPATGLPITTVTETDGSRRLAVDAQIDAGDIHVDTRPLQADTDTVSIGDPNNSNTIAVNADGTIDVNTVVNANSDSIVIAGTTDGTFAGPKLPIKVNPDGSINVVTSGTPTVTAVKSFFNDITNVGSGATEMVITYTVPVGKTGLLQGITFSGSGIATYDVTLNASEFDRQRTYYSGGLTQNVSYALGSSGIPLSSGDVLEVTVTNVSPNIADFESRIQITEVG